MIEYFLNTLAFLPEILKSPLRNSVRSSFIVVLYLTLQLWLKRNLSKLLKKPILGVFDRGLGCGTFPFYFAKK